MEYVGPGRETPPPEKPTEIKIGWFGPPDPRHPTAGAMWQAAIMAIDQANRAGGLDGIPFRLVPCWAENPWGTGVKEVTRLVYDQRVWALVGAPDGPSAHLIEQITAKARLPLVSCVATDQTANLAGVPWIFSCAPGDQALARLLARAVVSRAGGLGIVVVAATDHDSRVATTELLAALNELSAFPTHRLDFPPGGTDFGMQLDTIRQARPTVVVVMAGPADSARFVSALRSAGLTMPVFGGPSLGRQLFVDLAAGAAEGVRFPVLWSPAANRASDGDFAGRFAQRFGSPPDYTAAYTYDAVTLLIAAIRQGGLNRARIRDAIRRLSPWSGVTGTIAWNPTGQNTRPITMGTIRQGRIVPLPHRDGRVDEAKRNPP